MWRDSASMKGEAADLRLKNVANQAVSQQTFELVVLRLQFLQSLGIRNIHAAKAVTPAEEGLFSDVVSLAQVADRDVLGLSFPQDADDLFFGKTFLHWVGNPPICNRTQK